MHAFASPNTVIRSLSPAVHVVNPLDAVRRVANNQRHWFSYSNGIAVGTWRRIPIYVAPSWLFVSAVLLFSYASVAQYRLPGLPLGGAYLIAVGFVGLFLASVLVHELAHALVARRFGTPVESVTVWMLGGYTRVRHEPATPGAEFVMAASGPAASLALGLLGVGGAQIEALPAWLDDLFYQLAVSNLTIAVFNVLPGLPLDGGIMIRAVAWRATGDRLRATVIAARAGQGLAVILLGFAFGLIYAETGINPGLLVLTFLIPFFLWISASHTVRRSHMRRRIAGLSVRAMARRCVAVPSDASLADALAARASPEQPIVVTDGSDVMGTVPAEVIAATPAARHEHIAVGHLVRHVEPHHVLPASGAGAELWQAVTGHQGPGGRDANLVSPSHYVVTDADRVIGVISDTDLAHAIEPPLKLWNARRLADAWRSWRYGSDHGGERSGAPRR